MCLELTNPSEEKKYMLNGTSHTHVARLLLAAAILVEAMITGMPAAASTSAVPLVQEQAVPQPPPSPQWPEVDQIVQNALTSEAPIEDSIEDSVEQANTTETLHSMASIDGTFEILPTADAVIVISSADDRAKNSLGSKMVVQSRKQESTGQPLAQVEFVNVASSNNPDEAGASLSPLNVAFKLTVDRVASANVLKSTSTEQPPAKAGGLDWRLKVA